VICRFGRHGQEHGNSSAEEPPSHLRYQRYQFSHTGGRFRKRSYRSGLGVAVPKNVEGCRRLIRMLAKKVYVRNGSVDEEDLVQIGETLLWEHVPALDSGAIRRPAAAWRMLLETIQAEMFHAIDQQFTSLDSRGTSSSTSDCGDESAEFHARLLEAGKRSQVIRRQSPALWEVTTGWGREELPDALPTLPAAQCNRTVFCQRGVWDFVPDCCESWGAPLPPGSCQPRPSSLCEMPRHLPLVYGPPNGKAAGLGDRRQEAEPEHYDMAMR